MSKPTQPDELHALIIEVRHGRMSNTKAHQAITTMINEARQSELEMFKKIPIEHISKEVAKHISDRYSTLTKPIDGER